jgi:F420-dependent oxidoreductase-like protein
LQGITKVELVSLLSLAICISFCIHAFRSNDTMNRQNDGFIRTESEGDMLLGHHLLPCYPSQYGNHFDTMLAVAKACESANLDSVWLPDHFMFDDSNTGGQIPVLECFITLGAFASATSRIRLGALVAGIPYRNPALFAKMAATLDVISHGRTIVGIGAGWHEPEFTAYGWPFPSVGDRMDMLEEAVQIIDQMLQQQPASFQGKHYAINKAYNEPPAIQHPRPPIMIGGSGERRTLKLVAQYADYCNLFGNVEEVARLYQVLRTHCNTVGRPYDAITRSNHVSILIAKDTSSLQEKMAQYPDFKGIIGTPPQVIEQLARYAAVGSQYITFGLPNEVDIEAIQLIGAEVVPQVAAF